jgi:UDP-2,4-diacetamido-2,4,6-trideoxy-beta-L-altropyranose hydrolase
MRIVFRADGNTSIGTGHVMRCLALAQACHDCDLDVALASAELPAALAGRWSAEGVPQHQVPEIPGSLEDANRTARLSRELDARWVVVDGYRFSLEYLRRLKELGCRVLSIDDRGCAGPFCADVILNQNAYADRSFYPDAGTSARLLLGLRYLLLRREFRVSVHRRGRVTAPRAAKLLVTLGGSDPDNATCTVLESLQRLNNTIAEVRLLVGASNPHTAAISALAASVPAPVEIVRDASRPSEAMEWADFAVAAAGTTAWELAFMGVPFLALAIAENQRLVAESLARQEIAVNLGPANELNSETLARHICRLAGDPESRDRMSNAGRRLIDGEGAFRAIQAMDLLSLTLRSARHVDSELLWEWANDPLVRRFSFHSDPIPWESHQEWFARKMNDPNCALWIAYDREDRPVGQIRFDRENGDTVSIGISVASASRGNGYAAQLLRIGLRRAAYVFPGCIAHASIKVENAASLHAFESAGLSLAGRSAVHGYEAFDLWRAL